MTCDEGGNQRGDEHWWNMRRRAIKRDERGNQGGNHLEQLVARVERDEQGVQIRRLGAPSMR